MDKDKKEERRRKTSKYFSAPPEPEDTSMKSKPSDAAGLEKTPPKRKSRKSKEEADEDEDFELPSANKTSAGAKYTKKLKSESDLGMVENHATLDEDEDLDEKVASSHPKARGRGSGGRGSGAATAAGRGRGGGRGGFMSFGERKDPPHKGEKVKTAIFMCFLSN